MSMEKKQVNFFEKHEDDEVLCGVINLIAGSFGGMMQTIAIQPFDTVKVKQQAFPHIYSSAINCFIKTYRDQGVIRGLYAGTLPAIASGVLENSVLFASYGNIQHLVSRTFKFEHSDELPAIADAIAGGVAGSMISLFVCPAELIKCKLQAWREKIRSSPNNAVKMVGVWELTKKIYQKQGLRGFYTGLIVTNIRDVPGFFFCFGGYEGARIYFTKPDETRHDIGLLNTMISGGFGGVLLWLVSYPMDVIKSRIQINSINTNPFTFTRDVVRKEGVATLYQGLFMCLVRSVPAAAILFIVVEYTTGFLHKVIN